MEKLTPKKGKFDARNYPHEAKNIETQCYNILSGGKSKEQFGMCS